MVPAMYLAGDTVEVIPHRADDSALCKIPQDFGTVKSDARFFGLMVFCDAVCALSSLYINLKVKTKGMNIKKVSRMSVIPHQKERVV